MPAKKKTLNNTTASKAKKNVSDIEFFGDGDMFKLLSKASSKSEGWMKSTKAMEIEDEGCLVQVTTQHGDNVAEALQWVPDVHIVEHTKRGKVVGRSLESNFEKKPYENLDKEVSPLVGDEGREISEKVEEAFSTLLRVLAGEEDPEDEENDEDADIDDIIKHILGELPDNTEVSVRIIKI